jgi:DNA-binding HxlR family transcriptional regulator
MPLRSDWSDRTCPIARSLDVVGDPWVLLVVRQAMEGSRRFDEFKRELGVADNILSKRLSAMVEAGLLTKVPYRGEHRTHHEYLLTEAGADLLPVLHGLLAWGEKHRPLERRRGRLRVIHERCGTEVDTADWCDRCSMRLSPEQVTWSRTTKTSTDISLVGAVEG